MNLRRSLLWTALALPVAAAVLAVSACSSPIPRRDPTGEVFPTVRGESLAGESVEFPAAGAGEPLLLLVGYVQDAQFDLDRWLLGMRQLGIDVAAFELPTIDGMVPGLFAGQIDDGMRGGIPEEDWVGVVTLYRDAGEVTRFTGTERPRNGRILLLDGAGRVVWFWDRGYSADAVLALSEAVAATRSR